MEHEIIIQPTPNPNAYKFICPGEVKTTGKSTYKSPKEAINNYLAKELFKLRGVDTLHFAENYIVLTKFLYKEWDEFEKQIISCIQSNWSIHNPNYEDYKPLERCLTEEEKELDEILTKFIRPVLQSDGGDIKVIALNGNTLELQYLGACNGCGASGGTLQGIKAILKREFSPDLEIKIV